jgi:hypothetical protein
MHPVLNRVRESFFRAAAVKNVQQKDKRVRFMVHERFTHPMAHFDRRRASGDG